MRNFKYTLLLLFVSLNIAVSAQTIQGSIIGVSGEPNSVYVVMRPSANITGQLTDFQFTLAIPASSSAIRPVATFTSLVTNLLLSPTSYLQTLENIGPSGSLVSNYVYTFSPLGTGVATTTYTAGTSYNIAKVKFSIPGSINSVVRLVQLPNGGSTLQSNFFVAFNNNADATNPTVPFFGGGAVNDGQGYTGYSFVPLNITLPTKFLSFFATKTDDAANLTWTVDNEENNSYFEVERSLDGRNFSKAYQVNALRNGRTSNTYTTPDANISRLGVKVVYYRIKQVEASGQIVYSEIRQVSLTDKSFSASLYPNPVKTSTKLVIDAPEAGKASVIIRDVAGKTVKALSLQLVKGINQQQLDASMFAAGDYNVTIVSEKLNQTIKMTKAN